MRVTKRGRSIIIIAVSLAVLAGIAVVARQLYVRYLHPSGCTVTTATGELRTSTEQAANAATIAAVGVSRELPERAITIALATAMQESKLRNLSYGDRDSVGLFQQRPSQGWGTEEQLQDPVYAAGRFYDALTQISGYSRLPLTVAAQQVQRSATPTAYARHEDRAAILAAALSGREPGALTCRYRGNGDYEREEMAENGLTPRADRVRTAVVRDHGELGMGGFQPGGVQSGHIEDSAHYDGRAIDVFFRPVDDRRRQQGWSLAQWAVAHARELGIATVIFDGRIWTARRSSSGWRTYEHPSGPTDDPVLMHRDHVHVDVVRGS